MRPFLVLLVMAWLSLLLVKYTGGDLRTFVALPFTVIAMITFTASFMAYKIERT